MELLVLRLISSKEELDKLASSMRSYAESNPIEPNAYLNQISQDEHLSSVNEHDTGMMVAKSKRMLSAVTPFTAHITFDRKIAYQLQYWVYEGEMAQLTLVRLDKGPLDPKITIRVLQSFFGEGDKISLQKGTPQHVAIFFHQTQDEEKGC